MYPHLKQFVPSTVCLKCDGCCRFREAKGCWRPKVTPMEILAAGLPPTKENVFSPRTMDPDSMVRTIPWQGTNLCYFFHVTNNTCGIYPQRPFECRLYPVVILGTKGNYRVGLHLACPYIQDKKNSGDFGVYVNELKKFFQEKASARFLQEYLQFEHVYPGFEGEMEMLFPLSVDSPE